MMLPRLSVPAFCLLLIAVPERMPVSAQVLGPEFAPSVAPPVVELFCLPDSGIVDRFDTYRLTFRTSDTVPVAGAFRVTFPEGFDLSTATATYSDTPRPDTPGIAAEYPDYQSYWIRLDSTGTPAPAGTMLQLTLALVYNPTLATGFSVALEILDSDTTLFGPTLSAPFYLQPDLPDLLELQSNAFDTVVAGTARQYVTEVADRFGNEVFSVALTYRVEPDSLGTFTGDVFYALRPGTGLVVVSHAALADTSGTLVVTPGPLARWEWFGVPPSVVAGSPASASIIQVRARDALGNLQFLYTDSVYFITGDSTASLPATRTAPYFMTLQDSGTASFPGSSFVWRKAGQDSLRMQGGGAFLARPVTVSADGAIDFQLLAPDTVVAGVPFALSVVGLRDRFGNAATGLVTLLTSSADSLAPNGQVPSLPAVSAVAGSGTTSAALYRAGGYPVFGRLGDSLRSTASITVMPQAAKSFVWTVSSPLVASVPVDSPFALAALDAFRNRVHQFAQAGASVTLSATTGDSVSPAVLAPANFLLGEVDLFARNFTYYGSGGTLEFVATSAQASGTSPPVEVQALFAESLAIDQAVVRRGADTLTGSIRLRLLGLGTVTIASLELGTSQGSFQLSNLTPMVPAYLTGPSVVSFQFRWPVPSGLAEGNLRLTCRTLGQFPSGSVVDVCPDSASVTVTRAAAPALLSLSPGTVAYDDARYLATLTNLGAVGISFHLDSSRLVFASVARRDTARVEQGGLAYLGPSDTLSLEYLVRHTSAFPGDTARAEWQVRGTELAQPVQYSLPAPSRLNYVSPAQLSYLAGSLSPDSAVVGQADTLRLRIRHSGGVSVAGAAAELKLAGLSDTVTVDLARSITPLAAWSPGDTTLAFVLAQSDLQIEAGAYVLRLTVEGEHNRIDTAFTAVLTDSLWLFDRPTLSLDSLQIVAPNRPRVSANQTFSIAGLVANTGLEAIDSVRLRLVSDGKSLLTDTLNTDTLSIPFVITGGTQAAVWNVIADSLPNPLESFHMELLYGVGRVTRQRAVLSGSQQNFAAVQIQTVAKLEMQARLFSPDDALDGRIAAGSPFEVAGKFINTGEASTSGAPLTILTTGGLSVVGPADTISRAQDVEAIWSLQAPSADTTAMIIVMFASPPQDLNTGLTALVRVSADTLTVRIAFEAPPLRVLDVQTQGGALAGPYEPLTWTWTNGDPTGLFPILVKQLILEATGADGTTLLDASAHVERAELELASDTVSAVITGSTVRFGTDSLSRVAPGQSEAVILRIWPKLSGALTEFRWATRSALWQVVERQVNGAGLPVPVLDERGGSLNIVSDLAFIPGPDVSNYPNPFRAGGEVTQIQYQLSSPSQVSIAVYAASGHEVWKHQAEPGGTGGQSGPNTVVWDGRNGHGDVVVDGVYFARIKSTGLDATIKIVVMK